MMEEDSVGRSGINSNVGLVSSTPPRVHFNPVVSQLSYTSSTQFNDGNIIPPMPHQNRSNNPMKNLLKRRSQRHSFSSTSSSKCVPRPTTEKVQKVVVTIAVASSPGEKRTVPQTSITTYRTPSTCEDIDQPQFGRRKESELIPVPDLLSSTPLFERKQVEWATQADRKKCDSQLIVSASAPKTSSCGDALQNPWTEQVNGESSNRNNSRLLLKTWKSGLVKRLTELKGLLRKSEKSKDEVEIDDGEKVKVKKQERKQQQSGSHAVSQHSSPPSTTMRRDDSCSMMTDASGRFNGGHTHHHHPPSHPPPSYHPPKSFDPVNQNYGRTDAGGEAGLELLLLGTNHHRISQEAVHMHHNHYQDQYQYQHEHRRPPLTLLSSSPVVGPPPHRHRGRRHDSSPAPLDEFSDNMERILEEIEAGLEDMEQIQPSDKDDDDKSNSAQITDLVNELSAVLSSLTESCTTEVSHCSSTKLSSPALVSAVGMGTADGGDGSRSRDKGRPPLPPAHKAKHLNSVLRNQFFQHPSFKMEGSSSDLSPRRAEPLKARHHGLRDLKLEIDIKLLELKEQLLQSREEISKFQPNFDAIDDSVRSSMAIDRFGRNPPNSKTISGWENSTSSLCSQNSATYTDEHDSHSSRTSPHCLYEEQNFAKQSNWDSIVAETRKKFTAKNEPYVAPEQLKFSDIKNGEDCTDRGSRKCVGILETDLDTGASREVVHDSHFTDFSDTFPVHCRKPLKIPNNWNSFYERGCQNTCSMQTLHLDTSSGTAGGSKEDRSRSMEFLSEDQKQAVLPPENTLKKNQENRQPSEHELRIQRSLQRLNVPDWYKNYATTPTSPAILKPAGKDFGSGTGLAGGWSGLSCSKTSSLTSLQTAGRYAGSKTRFSSARHRDTTPSSLMSPSSTASASPSPYFERSSFTYGMPYAMSRFATARMSCGASPASLSPSPSPVGGITSSTSTPVSSGPLRYGYNKTPYLGWRSQERLNSKSLYRSPSERAAADLLAQKQKSNVTTPVSTGSETSISIVTSPRKETASDLSLNISDTSESSNKLNRVRSSIKEVSNAIVDYVNETKPLDDNINGRASPYSGLSRRGMVWLESSFVGTKPIDSPGETPSVIMNKHTGSRGTDYLNNKRINSVKLEQSINNGESSRREPEPTTRSSESSHVFSSYLSRNEKLGERSKSSSVSSPTLDDILDSLLALRRPHKKIRPKGLRESTLPSSSTPAVSTATVAPPPLLPKPPAPPKPRIVQYDAAPSDWQQRINPPLDDTMYFPPETASCIVTTSSTPAPPAPTFTTSACVFDDDSNNTTQLTQGVDDNIVNCVFSSQSGVNDAVFSTTNNVVDSVSDGATSSQNNEEEDNDEDSLSKIAQEESNFGTPTEINTTTIIANILNNPLAGLNESITTPPTPARHRRVSFDLDISDKEEKSSSRSKRDESIGSSIQCKNSKCGKGATGLEARREFKTCHNCNAYYCSRECRRTHWEKHKKVCMQSRVGQVCKQIISHVKDDSFVVSHLSTVAKRGFLAKGRGCVKLFFSSPDRAERFLTGGLPELPEPWYIPHSDMLPEEMGTPTFSELSDQCRAYNAETRFVVYVSVCVVNEVPTSGAVKWERELISRSAKIRLLLPRSFDDNQGHHYPAPASHLNLTSSDEARTYSPPQYQYQPGTMPGSSVVEADTASNDENETLILRSVPIPASLKLNSNEDRKRREISFTNIQKHLIERGVDLRRLYPEIYSRLCNYVENDEPFLPATIYPTNPQTGSQFMCVIMPESADTSYAISSSSPGGRVETINISE